MQAPASFSPSPRPIASPSSAPRWFGDEVVGIDGRSMASLLPYEAKALLRTPGQTRRLSLRRGASTIVATLLLSQII